MSAPRWRKASTRSPIGRSCIRGTPDRWYAPPASASAAVRGRNAVPAFPRNKSADLTGTLPPQPATLMTPSPTGVTFTPRVVSASSIRSVSSDLSKSRTSVSPSAKAASNRMRFDRLLEPGRRTDPCADTMPGRSRKDSLLINETYSVRPVLAFITRIGINSRQGFAIAINQCLTNAHQSGAVAIQLGQQGRTIREGNIAPHFRVTPGNTCEVAEPRSCIIKQLICITALGKFIDQRIRQQVRQMTHSGKNAIMCFGIENMHIGATELPGTLHFLYGFGGIFRERRQHDFTTLVQVHFGGCSTTRFCPGNRMPRDELADLVTKGLTGGSHNIALGAACIGHNRMLAQVRRETLKNLRHLPDRRGHQNEICFAHIGTGIDTHLVDEAQIISCLQTFRRATETDDLINGMGGFKAAGKRSANQPYAENQYLAKMHSVILSGGLHGKLEGIKEAGIFRLGTNGDSQPIMHGIAGQGPHNHALLQQTLVHRGRIGDMEGHKVRMRRQVLQAHGIQP